MSVARYYSWLSWFQDAARAFGHDTGRDSLTVHRLLATPTGEVSGDVLHERVLEALTAGASLPPAPIVLDAGCGLGGTSFYLHTRLGATCRGITLSPAQCARANAEAGRRGVAGACRFSVRSYDDPLDDLLPEGADVIVAIESLAHAADPAASVARLAARLRPGGRLVVVDDMPEVTLARDDADFVAFRAGWLCPVVAGAVAYHQAFATAGLVVTRDDDLTPLMPARSPRALARLIRLNAVGRRVLALTPARVLMASGHGGLMLERLYQRRQMTYRLLVAARPATAHPAF